MLMMGKQIMKSAPLWLPENTGYLEYKIIAKSVTGGNLIVGLFSPSPDECVFP